MEHQLTIYNTLDRKKELFVPLHAPHVGMYVCGPTVYGDAHLGHARPAITFDLLFRYLTHIGYKVRYVRNITDVGHLEHDADDGEDKIAKKARLEHLYLDYLNKGFVGTFDNEHPELDRYTPYIYAGMLFNVSMAWLENDCAEDADSLAESMVGAIFD